MAIDDALLERTLLRHSDRGIEAVARHLGRGYCRRAAEALWRRPRGRVLLCTGFPVGGTYETDGPVGTAALYAALETLDYEPHFVAAPPVAHALAERYRVWEFPILPAAESGAPAERLLAELDPVALVAVERPGEAADGRLYNMRGEDITDRAAKLSVVFRAARCLTVGVGDGGNEIGMGSALAALERLTVRPCVVPVDCLVVATTSNWGVYGLVACLEHLSRAPLLAAIDERAALDFFLARRALDGRTLRSEPTVDGHSLERSAEVLAELRRAIGG